MEDEKAESVMKEPSNQKKGKGIDDLLSMRGKPFEDWKEEKKYLQDKWGAQGRKMELSSQENEQAENESLGKPNESK